MMTGGCGHDAWVVACFCTHLDFPDDFLLDTPEGPVKAYNVCDALDWKAVPNIAWLVPMAHESCTNPDFGRADISYDY